MASFSGRILPISSLRFVLASIVFLGHLGLPFLTQPQTGVLWFVRAFKDNAVDGPAAVIVFFVISGFCIHYPNRKGRPTTSWKQYYERRYIRILIPMGAAVALAYPLKFRLVVFGDSILWSLICEEFYYLLYPVFLRIQARIGWRGLLSIAWILSTCVILTKPRAMDYPSYGNGLNWIVGLPCWLLGAYLAARFESIIWKQVKPAEIWLWRLAVYSASVAASALAFHTPVGAPWTLNLFAILAARWLEKEIAYYRDRQPGVLERWGEMSYSLYLTHLHGFELASLLGFSAWIPKLVISGMGSLGFYAAVERPAHQLARRVSRRP